MNTADSFKQLLEFKNQIAIDNQELFKKLKISTICEECPTSIFFITKSKQIKCFCPAMNCLTVDTTETNQDLIQECSQKKLEILKSLQELQED